MFKRRSTLEPSEKIKRNRQVQHLLRLEKCLQIPNDDKLILRQKIKQNSADILYYFQNDRKQNNLQELQIKLRKYVQMIRQNEKINSSGRYGISQQKGQHKHNQRVYSQQSQNNSLKNSLQNSAQKDEQPVQCKHKIISFDISELKNKIQLSQKSLKVGTPVSQSAHFVSSHFLMKRNQYPQSKIASKKIYPTHMNQSQMNNSQSTRRIINQFTGRQNKENTDRKDYQQSNRSQIRIQAQQQIEKSQLYEITNMSYSSSIKNLLKSKLKKNDKKILESSRMDQVEFNEQVTVRKHEQNGCTLRLFDQAKHVKSQNNKTETRVESEQQTKRQAQNKQTIGFFYKQIRSIIESDNF